MGMPDCGSNRLWKPGREIEMDREINYMEQIRQYQPYNEEEKQDRETALKYLKVFPDLLSRKNEFAHVTVSSWILNPDFTKTILVYHNIYQSWSWVGGHADGEGNLMKAAVREALEETGLTHIEPVTGEIFSLEILLVDGHWKHDCYISSHVHINVTFLLTAGEEQVLKIKPDENSGVRWTPLNQVENLSREPFMKKIYRKLIEKTHAYAARWQQGGKREGESRNGTKEKGCQSLLGQASP